MDDEFDDQDYFAHLETIIYQMVKFQMTKNYGRGDGSGIFAWAEEPQLGVVARHLARVSKATIQTNLYPLTIRTKPMAKRVI